MNLMKYDKLRVSIKNFFSEHRSKELLTDLTFSPYGEKCGPDIMRLTLVAEIKDKVELDRDLPSAFWSNWNSEKTAFGGKVKGYKLENDLPSELPADGKVKGWIATIFGQLRNYSVSANLPDGWLIIENYDDYKDTLLEALNFLSKTEKDKRLFFGSTSGHWLCSHIL